MTLVKWTTPQVVRRHEWQTQGKPELFRVAGYAVKWTLLLGLPVLYAVWQYAPFALRHVVISILSMPFVIILQIGGQFVVLILAGRECRLDNNGLLYKVGNDNRRIRWRQINAWTIEDHPRIAGIRVLTVKAVILRRTRTRHFPFNPRITDENYLHQMLRLRVPTQ